MEIVYKKPEETAAEFFVQWKEFTIRALEILAPSCPHTQTKKVRPWTTGSPKGVILHYTGGSDGIASTRWANENPDNKGSSWHATVFDHRIKQVDHLLDKFPLVKVYLPVTALFIGSLKESTWHGNWANGLCFGIENRNMGLLTKVSGGWTRSKHKYNFNNKYPVKIRGKWWEPFTKGQILANISICRALRALYPDMDKGLILPHSAVWAGKSDTGSAFPIYGVRDSIFLPVFSEIPSWLSSYVDHTIIEVSEGELFDSEMQDLSRDLDPNFYMAYNENISVSSDDVKPLNCILRIKSALVKLGYWEGIAIDDRLDSRTIENIKIFQKSTYDDVWMKKHGRLKVDGIPGPNTEEQLVARLKDFGFYYHEI